MDNKIYENTNLRILNDCLTQTIEVLARAQRLGLSGYVPQGLNHSVFGPTSVFGVPAPQGIGVVDPRGIDLSSVGLTHTPYGYPYAYPGQAFGFGGQPAFPAFVDPFVAQRGLSHSGIPTGISGALPGQTWTGWSPLVVEIQRQRELQALLARQQYEAMCRSVMGV